MRRCRRAKARGWRHLRPADGIVRPGGTISRVGIIRRGGIISRVGIIRRVGVPQYDDTPVGFGSLVGGNVTLTEGPVPARA